MSVDAGKAQIELSNYRCTTVLPIINVLQLIRVLHYVSWASNNNTTSFLPSFSSLYTFLIRSYSLFLIYLFLAIFFPCWYFVFFLLQLQLMFLPSHLLYSPRQEDPGGGTTGPLTGLRRPWAGTRVTRGKNNLRGSEWRRGSWREPKREWVRTCRERGVEKAKGRRRCGGWEDREAGRGQGRVRGEDERKREA